MAAVSRRVFYGILIGRSVCRGSRRLVYHPSSSLLASSVRRAAVSRRVLLPFSVKIHFGAFPLQHLANERRQSQKMHKNLELIAEGPLTLGVS